MESNKSAALASSLTGIICDVRIRRSVGEHRTRLTSANRQRRRHWPPDAMARRCREFVDSRLRRSPPDRASAVPYGQAGENAMRFPRLAHRSAAAHKLHSTPQQHRMNLNFGERVQPAADYRPLAYSSPEAVQTTGTVVEYRNPVSPRGEWYALHLVQPDALAPPAGGFPREITVGVGRISPSTR